MPLRGKFFEVRCRRASENPRRYRQNLIWFETRSFPNSLQITSRAHADYVKDTSSQIP